MTSATPFGFSSSVEPLDESGNIPHYLFTAKASSLSESPGEGRSASAGDFSTQSTVTTLKTENWTRSTSNQGSLETGRLRQTRQDASHSNIDRLALLASVASASVFGSSSSTPSFTTNMSTYISSSNGQAEALQTLHLMNPNFTSYGDLSNSGNSVLFSPGACAVGGQGSPLGSSGQQHQHHIRYALPPAVNQPSYSHPSQMAAMSNTEIGHQSPSSDLYAKRTNHQGYNWGGGNEFSFLPSGHVTENNQQMSNQMNVMKPGHISTSNMSQYGVGSMNASPYHEQATLFANGVVGHAANMDNLQAPSGAGHVLSLSLSPQQPSMVQQLHSYAMQTNESTANFFHGLSNNASDNLSKESMFSIKCADANNVGGSYTIAPCDNMLGMGYQAQLNTAESRHVDMLTNHMAGCYGSKYLKPAQELLNEVVSVGEALKGNVLKKFKPQLWTAATSANNASFVKSMDTMDATNKALIGWGGGKEGDPVVAAVPINLAGISEHTPQPSVELSSAERQDLQAKRAKLLGMRDEVDRRYKQYYHQMDMVARSFESAAGLGAASAYTALALQTISKHFRCLRDAITGQIQVACKALGEEEVSGITRGETSKLRFIDQQLRQQRALRQLGMMQQQAWRPQRGLPEHSVSVLRAWLFEHFLHPYPKDADKIMLAKQTGLNRSQVSNWFINARVRLWKPMVEEMYLEEVKDADAERADKQSGNEGNPHEGEMAVRSEGAPSSEFSKPFKQAKLSDENCEAFGEVKGASNYPSEMLQGRILTGSPPDNMLFHDKDSIRQGVVKLTHAPQYVSSLLSGTGVDYKASKVNGEDDLERENRIRSDDSYKEFTVSHNGLVQADLPMYGSYQMNGMSRYGHESFGASYAANGGVSLTLGLQHCEDLSFSGGQQHYGQAGSGHLLTSRRADDGVGSADYYNVNESSYEVLGLQSRKPFPTHMLCHDFAV